MSIIMATLYDVAMRYIEGCSCGKGWCLERQQSKVDDPYRRRHYGRKVRDLKLDSGGVEASNKIGDGDKGTKQWMRRDNGRFEAKEKNDGEKLRIHQKTKDFHLLVYSKIKDLQIY